MANQALCFQAVNLFNGDITPNAPDDLVSALGKNVSIINVVPSENLVWIEDRRSS